MAIMENKDNLFALLIDDLESDEIAVVMHSEENGVKVDSTAEKEKSEEKAEAVKKAAQPDYGSMRAKRLVLPYHVLRSQIVVKKSKPDDTDGDKNSGNGANGVGNLRSHSNNGGQRNYRRGENGYKQRSDKKVEFGNESSTGSLNGDKMIFIDEDGFQLVSRRRNGGSVNGDKEADVGKDSDNQIVNQAKDFQSRKNRSNDRVNRVYRSGNRGYRGHGERSFAVSEVKNDQKSNGSVEIKDLSNKESNNSDTKENVGGVSDEKKNGAAEGTVANETSEKERKALEKERKQKAMERERKARDREEEAKRMTLEEYEKKVLAEKRKALESFKSTEDRQSSVDKDFESMKLVGKKNEISTPLKNSEEKLKKKETVERQHKSSKSMSIEAFLKPANGNHQRFNTRNRNARWSEQEQSAAVTVQNNVSTFKQDLSDDNQFPLPGK